MYDFVLLMPAVSVLVPITLPTFYLWLVDTWALRRGTWVIVKETKLGVNLWDGLDIEYAHVLPSASQKLICYQGSHFLLGHQLHGSLRSYSLRQSYGNPSKLP